MKTIVIPAHSVVPAKAGTQGFRPLSSMLWIPAFAGMTTYRHA